MRRIEPLETAREVAFAPRPRDNPFRDSDARKVCTAEGARHRPGSLTCGDDEYGSGKTADGPGSGDCRRHEPARFDRVYGCTKDLQRVVTAARVRSDPGRSSGQCSCFGSDQPDRPVTALKERSSRPINCSASSFEHSCSRRLSTRASAWSASAMALSEKYSR